MESVAMDVGIAAGWYLLARQVSWFFAERTRTAWTSLEAEPGSSPPSLTNMVHLIFGSALLSGILLSLLNKDTKMPHIYIHFAVGIVSWLALYTVANQVYTFRTFQYGENPSVIVSLHSSINFALGIWLFMTLMMSAVIFTHPQT